jgi:hypothetical protein
MRMRILRGLAMWLGRALCILGVVGCLYFCIFFAWLSAGPGHPYEQLYAWRANLWFSGAVGFGVTCVLSFALPWLHRRRRARQRVPT